MENNDKKPYATPVAEPMQVSPLEALSAGGTNSSLLGFWSLWV